MPANKDVHLSTLGVLFISMLSGMVLGLLTLCFYRPLINLVGGNLSHETIGIIHRGISSGSISLLALFPMVAMLRNRSDFLAKVLIGPLMGFGAFLVLLGGGIYRWGAPPDFAWPLGGLYVLYIILLSVAAMIIAKKWCSASNG
jgi:hypothetical protein